MTDTPTNDGNRLLFAGLSVLELHEADACEPARRAVALVSRLVAELLMRAPPPSPEVEEIEDLMNA